MIKKIFLFVSLSSLLFSNSAKLDNLFDLSLEELMNVEVTTVSQEKEKASEALAVVSVLTAAQLKQMGALTLYEALSFLPGIQINETYMGYSVLTFRGVTPGLYNNKVLFMVNGHPVHEKLFGSSHFEFIPLDMVERVEVVRSPASVLYGTNAMSGVVNVITKQGKEFNNEVAIRGGSSSHFYGSTTMHDSHISMSASYQNDNGYTYGGVKDEKNQDISKEYQNNLANIFIDAYGESWRLQGAYYQSKKEKLGLNPIIQHGGINNHDSFYLDANKEFKLGSGKLNLWLRYDNMAKELETQKFPNWQTGNPTFVKNKVERYSTEIQYKDKAFEKFNYIVGLNYEYDKTDPMLFIDQTDGSVHPWSPFQIKHHTENIALYAELEYRFSENIVGVGGFRLEHNSDTDTAMNPRLGLNYELKNDSYIKILYSVAYRSPTFLEKYADVPTVLVGDKDLKREKIQTLEVAYDSKINSKNTLQLTLYVLRLRDEITRRTASGGGSEYYNAKGTQNYGSELAINSIINEKTELMFNASYADGENKQTDEGLMFVAHYTANAMLSYHFSKEVSATLSDQFVSSKEYITTGGEKGEIGNYNLVNLSISYFKKPFETNLYLKNIFDERYTYPEPVRQNIKEIPGGAGASAYLTLRYYF